MEAAATERIHAGTTAEGFRAPEDETAAQMITGDRGVTGPAVADEVLVADRFRVVFLIEKRPDAAIGAPGEDG